MTQCMLGYTPRVNRMTHRWKNITLNQTSFAGGNYDLSSGGDVIVNVRTVYTEASASTLQQCCGDASDNVLIENNGITVKWVATLFLSDFTVFNENSIASITAALSQRRR